MLVYALVIYSLHSFSMTVVSHTPTVAQCQANGEHMQRALMNTVRFACLPSTLGGTPAARE